MHCPKCLSNVSVLNWIRNFLYVDLALQKDFMNKLTKIKDLELDEMWHFVKKN